MHNIEKYKKNYQLRKAVALRYRHGTDRSPVVTASGQGRLADRIISLAREHRVPVYEDKTLVEVLRTLKLGQEIPTELFETVAAILAFVMEVDRRQDETGAPQAIEASKQTKE